MAAPANMTTLDTTGQFYLNQTLSDDSRDTILMHQGVPWWKRRAISLGGVTLYIKHFKGDDGFEHIDIKQIVAGFEGTTENRILTWTEKEHEDHVFGPVIGKSRRVNPNELDNAYLKEGWLPEVYEHGGVQSYVRSNTEKSGMSWVADQTWGFEQIEVEPGKSEKRYVRHVFFTTPDVEDIKCTLVYDYLGPNDN